MSPESHHPTAEELFGYRDGELTPERRTLVEAHVLGCRQCGARLEAMSAAEGDLRSRPDDVDDEYYARMSESVLERIGAGTSAARGPERVERRRPEPAIEEKPRRSKAGSWLGVAGTVAAAAAVVVVVALLASHQGDWVRAPRPGVLGGPGSETNARPSEPGGAEPELKKREARREDTSKTVAAREPVAPASKPVPPPPPATAPLTAPAAPPSEFGSLSGERQRAAKDENESGLIERKADVAPTAGEAVVKTQSATQAIGAAGAGPGIAQDGSGGEYQRIVRSRGLPPTWDANVGRDALLGAEGPLRALYMSGRAGSDSARIRLYLAEAERLRLQSPGDSAAVDRILHHYWRAIRLAEGDPALSAIARRRLFEFQREVGERP